MAASRKTTTKNQQADLHDDEGAANRGSLRPDEMPPDVLEFITAIDDYKRLKQRPFPTWSEVLDILKRLGYQR